VVIQLLADISYRLHTYYEKTVDEVFFSSKRQLTCDQNKIHNVRDEEILRYKIQVRENIGERFDFLDVQKHKMR
jgi:hypothetical protein